MKQVQQRKFVTAFWLIAAFCFLMVSFQLQAQIQIAGNLNGDQFGYSTSFSADGKRVAISIGWGNSANDLPYVRIYEKIGNQWSLVGNEIIVADNGKNNGSSVSLSSDGKRVAIGLPGYKANYTSLAGLAVVYEETGGVWTQTGNSIVGDSFGDREGASIALSADGKRMVVGAVGYFFSGDLGYVKIYEENAGQWLQIGNSIFGDLTSDGTGGAVAMSADGKTIAIGAGGSEFAGAIRTGYVRIYEENTGIWTQVGTDLNGIATEKGFGRSIDLSSDGTRVIVGAPYNEGYVQIFEESAGNWSQIGSNIVGNNSISWTGISVSISSDGKTIAIGAGGHPLSLGHAQVYKEIGGNWIQIGCDIEEVTPGDFTGRAVSISGDGASVIVGAPRDDSNGNDSGQARIFDLSNINTNMTLTSQAEVDAFAPCVEVVEGDLAIHGTDITNLNALIGLEEVIGDVLISQNGLVDLSGLENLTSIGGGLSIVQNGDLVNLSGLDNLTEIGENFTISNNAVLQNLNGLDALKNIGNNLTISGNPLLNSLSGMDNMLSVGSICTIVTNPNLTDCCPIQPLLSSGVGGMTIIFFNNTGCESTMGINNACTASSNLLGNFNNNPSSITAFQNTILEAYPNPANDAVNIQVKNLSETSFLTILDHLGRVALQQEVEVGSSTILLQLKELGLSRGIYLMHLPVGEQLITKRLAVME